MSNSNIVNDRMKLTNYLHEDSLFENMCDQDYYYNYEYYY